MSDHACQSHQQAVYRSDLFLQILRIFVSLAGITIAQGLAADLLAKRATRLTDTQLECSCRAKSLQMYLEQPQDVECYYSEVGLEIVYIE